jgi:hypothetical protein
MDNGATKRQHRRLHRELGGILYDRDALNDELPYWISLGDTRHLVIPYSFETNDNRFDQNLGFATGDDFARYMIDCFEVMYEEGAEHAKLMSLALHDRLTGRPGRMTGLVKFLKAGRRKQDNDEAEQPREERPACVADRSLQTAPAEASRRCRRRIRTQVFLKAPVVHASPADPELCIVSVG